MANGFCGESETALISHPEGFPDKIEENYHDIMEAKIQNEENEKIESFLDGNFSKLPTGKSLLFHLFILTP